MRIDAILIKEQDNVATALRDIQPREKIVVGIGNKTIQIELQEGIVFGHKFAVQHISLGDHVFKYGEVIGRATQEILVGTHAHVHNIESLRGRGDLK
jgi:altronate dehydratase small subunit